MGKSKNNLSKHLLIIMGIVGISAWNMFIGFFALIIYISYLLVTYRKQIFSREGKAGRIILKFIIPLTAILVLYFYNRLLCLAAIVVYIALLLYLYRAGIFSIMGTLKYSRGDMDEAIKWLKMAYETGLAKVTTDISYGYLQLKQGNLEEAEKILNSILSKDLTQEEEMNVKSNLALVFWKKGYIDEAIALMEEAIKHYKTSTIYGSLGYLLIEKGDLEKALAFNLEAYEYNSRNAVIVDNLGQTYFLMGELEKAEELYKELMSTNPSFPEAYYNYALVLEKLDRINEAAEVIEKALNYRLSYLSTVTREEIEAKSNQLKNSAK